MKKYLITSPEYYSTDIDLFDKRLRKQLHLHMPEFVLFRDKTTLKYADLAYEFIKICKEFKNIKSYIHQDVLLAKELGADGIHLTSLQFNEIKNAKKNNLEVIISTHSLDEVLKAQNLGADYVTYSPIFKTPNKGKPKGIENLQDILNKCDIKVFALGGIIDKSHITEIKKTSVYGFASIRYFVNYPTAGSF